jgi:LPS-assembly protein
LNSTTSDRIRHAIRPQVIYNFIPPTSQDNLPNFDAVDRIDKVSTLTYSVTNIFSLRSRLPEENMKYTLETETTDDIGIDGSLPAYSYRPFCRFQVEQSYDFNETIEGEPFSPIFARLDLAAGRLLSLRADAQWSTYDSNLLTHNIALRAADKRGDRIYLQHRYAKDLQETFYADAIINLHERVAMFTEYERNIKDGNTLLYGFGFMYMASCWSLDIGYADEEGDKKYALMVNLYGLGGLGQAYTGRMIANPFLYD